MFFVGDANAFTCANIEICICIESECCVTQDALALLMFHCLPVVTDCSGFIADCVFVISTFDVVDWYWQRLLCPGLQSCCCLIVVSHEVQHYTNQLAKDTNKYIKDLTALPTPSLSSDQVTCLYIHYL